MLESKKNSIKLSYILLAYNRSKEQGQEAEFVRQFKLSPDDVQLLEREIALGNACGNFDELRRSGFDGSLADYLRQRGFTEEEITEVVEIDNFFNSFLEASHLFSKEELREIFGQISI